MNLTVNVTTQLSISLHVVVEIASSHLAGISPAHVIWEATKGARCLRRLVSRVTAASPPRLLRFLVDDSDDGEAAVRSGQGPATRCNSSPRVAVERGVFARVSRPPFSWRRPALPTLLLVLFVQILPTYCWRSNEFAEKFNGGMLLWPVNNPSSFIRKLSR